MFLDYKNESVKGNCSLRDTHSIENSVSFRKWQNMSTRDMEKFAHAHPRTFNRRLRRGVPQKFRWQAWKIWAEIKLARVEISSKLYSLLVNTPSKFHNLILIDVPRTFPDVQGFSESAHNQLYRILNAFATYKPDIGYCQGMNFVAGFILLVSEFKEKEAFEFFCSLMVHWRASLLYKDQFPLLSLYIQSFNTLMEQHCEHLYTHFEFEGIFPALYLHQWYLSIFVCGFPLRTTAVLWDYIIAEGLHGMVCISVGILKVLQECLLKKNIEETLSFFKALKQSGSTDEARIGHMLNKQADTIYQDNIISTIIKNTGSVKIPTEAEIYLGVARLRRTPRIS